MAESKKYYVEENGKEITKWLVKLVSSQEVAIAQAANHQVEGKEIRGFDSLQKASDVASFINRQVK